MIASHRLLGLMVLCSLSVACIPSRYMVVPSSESFESIPISHGVLIVRVADTDTGLPLEHLILAPKNAYESDEAQLLQIEMRHRSSAGTHTYVGVVPAGQYSLSELSGRASDGQIIFSRTVDLGPSFGTFAVGAGKLTNLGTVLVYSKPVGGLYQQVVSRNNSFASAAMLVKQEFPNIAIGLDNTDAPLTWDPDGYEDDRYEKYLNIVQNPLALERGKRVGDEYIVLSQAGAMLRYSGTGEWRLDLVDTDMPLLTIANNINGDEVVGGEDGALFWRASGDSSWRQVRPPIAGADILGVMISATREVIALSSSASAIGIFRARLDATVHWEPILTYRANSGWQEPDTSTNTFALPPLKRVSVVNWQDKFLVSERNKVYLIDALNETVTDVPLRGKVHRLAANSTSIVGVSEPEGWSYFGRRSYYWTEEPAANWSKLSVELDTCPGESYQTERGHFCADQVARKFRQIRFTDEPLLASNGDLYAVVQLQSVWDDYAHLLVESRNRGTSWQIKNDEQDYLGGCNNLHPGLLDNELFLACSGTSGKIYRYDLKTDTYQLIREPATF